MAAIKAIAAVGGDEAIAAVATRRDQAGGMFWFRRNRFVGS